MKRTETDTSPFFLELQPTDLEIHEVTTGTSLSTGMLPTTESIAPLNLRITPGKYEHPCQVKDLNLGERVPPQGI